jgi:hypothetical protein
MNNNSQQKAERLKALVSNPHLWSNFVEYLDYNIEQQHKVLEQSECSVGVQRAQGYIQALRKLKSLENIVKRD